MEPDHLISEKALPGNGQRDREGAALIGARADGGETAVVCLNQMFTDGQPNAAATASP